MRRLVHISLLLLVLAGCTTRQEYTTMRQGLDSINERNRNDEPFTASDVQPYVDYFDRHGEPNDRLLAHYLLGRAYHEQGEAPMALQCYQQAIECADTTASDCDFAQLSRVYAQMGQVFFEQNIYREFMGFEKKAEYFSWICKDTLSALICYEQQKVAYEELGIADSAIMIAEDAAKKYYQFNAMSDAAIVLGSTARLLLDKGNLEKAKKYMSKYEEASQLFNENGDIEDGWQTYYNIKGIYYLKVGSINS